MHPIIVAALWVFVGYGIRELQQMWAEHNEAERKALAANAEWLKRLKRERAARDRLHQFREQMQAKQGGNSAA